MADRVGRVSGLPPPFLGKRDKGKNANEPGEWDESSHGDLH